MAARGMDAVFQHLRRAVLLREGSGITDEQLVESFVANRDAAAFEALVRRHGKMVHGVCYRVLRDVHEAEDAYQATFLVLAQKAAKVIPRAQVGNWLYGVANTTALRAKSAAAKRKARERQVFDMPERISQGSADWNDLIPLLDKELTKLPAKYRVPIVLCDLEGRTRKDVAKELKIPEGTLSSRLTTARQMLAKRLTRHGLAVTGAALASLFAQNAVSAWVPPTLVASTVKAASLMAAGQAVASTLISAPVLALKEGVLKIMFIHKLKSLTSVAVLLGVFGYGGTLVTQRTGAAQSGVGDQGTGTLRVPSAVTQTKETDDKSANDGDGTRSVPATKKDSAVKPFDKEQVERQRQKNNLLLNAEVAYWNLYGAYGELYSVEEVLRVLHKLWQDTKTKNDSGDDKSPPDVLAQIKGQYEEFRGERTNALAAVLEAERNLCANLGLPIVKEGDNRLVPVSPPSVVSYQPKWEELLAKAMTHRPELLLARENLRVHQLNLANEKKALEKNQEDNKDAAAYRLENSSIRSARLQLAQAFYVLKDEEDRAKSTLAMQFRGLSKCYSLLDVRRIERRAYADSVAKKFKQVELGKRSVDLDMLDVHRRWALALTKEYHAIVEYNNTLARLDFATGTMKLQDIDVNGVKVLKAILNPKGEVFMDKREEEAGRILFLLTRSEIFSEPDKLTIRENLPGFLDKGVVPGITEVSSLLKTYQIEITLIEADPAGEDFGKEGKGEIVHRGRINTYEGRTGRFLSGGTILGPEGSTDLSRGLQFGIDYQVKVSAQSNGLLRLETELEMARRTNQDDKMIVLVGGTIIRAVALAKEGETVVLVVKNNKNEVTHWVRIKASEFTEELRKKMEQKSDQ